MSKPSAAKKSRRRRRRAARDDRWVPDGVLQQLPDADDEGLRLTPEVLEFDARITQRGWTFDEEFSSEDFVSWFFAPSAATFSDESVEPVTRIWLTLPDDLPGDDDFPNTAHVLLVGAEEGVGSDYRFAPDELFNRLDAIEAYRFGDPRPLFG